MYIDTAPSIHGTTDPQSWSCSIRLRFVKSELRWKALLRYGRWNIAVELDRIDDEKCEAWLDRSNEIR